MSNEQPTPDPSCMHNEVEPQYFKTACGSHYSCDEHNDRFVFCPYCGKDIDHDD